MKHENFYNLCMYLGKISGCHQRADRSFFIHGKQFPVCARCTGVFVGQAFSLVLIRFWKPSYMILLLFCGIMLFDWFIQYLEIKESSNWRRLITGGLCGYAFGTMVLRFLLAL